MKILMSKDNMRNEKYCKTIRPQFTGGAKITRVKCKKNERWLKIN